MAKSASRKMGDVSENTAKKRGRGKVACPQCQFACAVGDRFCRSCGSQLDDDSKIVEAHLARLIPDQIDTALTARFRDQKVVEVEIAQRLAERAMAWLKLVGFFAGIPLLVCGIALSLLGIKTYSDLQSAAEKAARLEGVATGTEKQMDAAKKRVDDVDTALKATQARIDSQLALLDRQQQSLQIQVKGIQARLSFCPNKNPTVELQNAIKEKLADYISYLERVGFAGLAESFSVCIYSKDDPVKITDDPLVDMINAFYEPSGRTIYIHKAVAPFPEVAIREYTQYALLSVAPNLSPDEASMELHQGLADYFTASFAGKAIIGEGVGTVLKIGRSYLRNLDNDHKYPDASPEPHDRGQVWAGALWRCRNELDRGLVDRIAQRAWSEFNEPGSKRETRRFTELLEKHERAARASATSCLAQQATQRELPR